MIYYSLPNFTDAFGFNLRWINYLKQNPEILASPDIKIHNLYDSFNNVIWNGGRVKIGVPSSILQMQKRFSICKDLNIGIRFTFSNSLLAEEHLKDYYSNLVLDLAVQSGVDVSVILVSDLLKSYIHTKYPQIDLISSVTDITKTPDRIKTLTGDFSYIVIPPELNHSPEVLQDVDLSKIEILVNEGCVKQCPLRAEHYRKISEDQLSYIQYEDNAASRFLKDNKCPLLKVPENIEQPLRITFPEILEWNKKGVSHFKIRGRQPHKNERLRDYCEYFIKEDFRDSVFREFIE